MKREAFFLKNLVCKGGKLEVLLTTAKAEKSGLERCFREAYFVKREAFFFL